jgi:ribosomal protein L34E
MSESKTPIGDLLIHVIRAQADCPNCDAHLGMADEPNRESWPKHIDRIEELFEYKLQRAGWTQSGCAECSKPKYILAHRKEYCRDMMRTREPVDYSPYRAFNCPRCHRHFESQAAIHKHVDESPCYKSKGE